MKIGLISDTHLPSTGKEPPPQVARAFEGVDLILHAGDIYVPSCLDWLERIAPVQAVEMYISSTWDGDARVASKRVVEVEGHAIGLVHDLALRGMHDEAWPGTLATAFPQGEPLRAALRDFFGRAVDIVVFGHTHVALMEQHHGVLMVNPGSATLPRQIMRLGTVAVLEVTTGGRAARIIDLAEVT